VLEIGEAPICRGKDVESLSFRCYEVVIKVEAVECGVLTPLRHWTLLFDTFYRHTTAVKSPSPRCDDRKAKHLSSQRKYKITIRNPPIYILQSCFFIPASQPTILTVFAREHFHNTTSTRCFRNAMAVRLERIRANCQVIEGRCIIAAQGARPTFHNSC
jgi:hypothetical protein